MNEPVGHLRACDHTQVGTDNDDNDKSRRPDPQFLVLPMEAFCLGNSKLTRKSEKRGSQTNKKQPTHSPPPHLWLFFYHDINGPSQPGSGQGPNYRSRRTVAIQTQKGDGSPRLNQKPTRSQNMGWRGMTFAMTKIAPSKMAMPFFPQLPVSSSWVTTEGNPVPLLSEATNPCHCCDHFEYSTSEKKRDKTKFPQPVAG